MRKNGETRIILSSKDNCLAKRIKKKKKRKKEKKKANKETGYKQRNKEELVCKVNQSPSSSRMNVG